MSIIRWEETANNNLKGFVGQIDFFEIIKGDDRISFLCMLPRTKNKLKFYEYETDILNKIKREAEDVLSKWINKTGLNI